MEKALSAAADKHAGEIEALRAKLAEAEAKSQRAISEAQLTKAGRGRARMTPDQFCCRALRIAGLQWKTLLGPMIGKCRTQVWEYATGKQEVPETVEKRKPQRSPATVGYVRLWEQPLAKEIGTAQKHEQPQSAKGLDTGG